MNNEIKGKCNYCNKPITYYPRKDTVNHFCDKQCYSNNQKGKPSPKKGCKLSVNAKKKISRGLKKYFKNGGIVWNKGKQLVAVRKNSKYYRQNPKYYLNELKQNAIRRKIKEYNKDPERLKMIKQRRKEIQKISGAGRRAKKWTDKEIKYLQNNYKETDFLTMALYLNRSWQSISHKVIRLKLKKYNNWTKKI